jgi:hypothetical protein
MKILLGGKEFEVSEDDLNSAKENGTLQLKSDDLVVRSKEEETAFLNNIKKETVNTAFEMEIKKRRNDLGLEFEGKTLDNLLSAHAEKIKAESTKKPSEALQEKERDIKQLQSTIKELQEVNGKVSNEFKSFKNESILNNTLSKLIPDNAILPKEDMMYLLKTKLNPVIEDGRVMFKDGDNVIKNKTTLDPLGAEEVVKGFFENNPTYLGNKVSGGNGNEGDSSLDDNSKSIEAFTKRMEANGVSANSVEFNQALNEAVSNKEVEI